MKITLVSDDRIRLDGRPGPMTVEAPTAEMQYSPFHMLASGLATCTYAVLRSWATNAGLEADDLFVEVGWSFVEDPHRVGRMEVVLEWPSLAPERHAAAQRVAALCTVKKTLEQPPEIATTVRAGAAATAGAGAP